MKYIHSIATFSTCFFASISHDVVGLPSSAASLPSPSLPSASSYSSYSSGLAKFIQWEGGRLEPEFTLRRRGEHRQARTSQLRSICRSWVCGCPTLTSISLDSDYRRKPRPPSASSPISASDGSRVRLEAVGLPR